VLCFTDGQHNVGPSPLSVGANVKAIADLVTVAFGSDADEKLLKELATTSQYFYRCKSGKELRAFLSAVGRAMSTSMGQKKDASQLLAQVNRE